MKKYLLNCMTILMVAIMSVGFMSCSSNDDDVKKEGEVSLVGTWVATNESSNTKLYLLLQANGNGSWLVDQNGRVTEDGEFAYTYMNNILTLMYKDSDEKTANGYVEEYTVLEVTSKKLVIFSGQTSITFYKE